MLKTSPKSAWRPFLQTLDLAFEQIMSSTTTTTKRELYSSSKTSPLLAALQRDGFIRVPSLLSHLQLSALRTAAETITQLARKGEWPHLRTVPKQFPPWPNKPPDEKDGSIWGVQHLLHPSMPGRNTFAELYFSDALLDIVRELVGRKDSHTGDDALVMELFNLLVSPTGKRDFELCWHRDDVRPDLDPQEEQRQLDEKSPEGRQLHAQYNIALYEDSSLVVIPGSHRRARTQAEREAEPYAPELPGQVTVTLNAGDGLFYDSNILHRGVYHGIDAETETGRMTLHGSVGLAGHGKQRARQVLQHGVGEWIDQAHFELGGEVGDRAEVMRKRLVEMGTGDDVGYSLEG
jgi:hypothetical protein